MVLEIKHQTQYAYSDEVFVEPQRLYFYPAHRPYQNVTDFHLEITPTPTGLSQGIDAEGNHFHQCWFGGKTSKVTLDVSFMVEPMAFNPFDFLAESDPMDHPIMGHYRKHDTPVKQLLDWTNGLQLSNDPIQRLSKLNEAIHEQFSHTIRYEENLFEPRETLESMSGSCRDLSWLMINALRQMDVPSRFVSGYAYNPELGEGHELHAWVEAWVPGGGWIAIDPSAGLFVDQHYVPVAASYAPERTLPVQGSFRGRAGSKLVTSVTIREI